MGKDKTVQQQKRKAFRIIIASALGLVYSAGSRRSSSSSTLLDYALPSFPCPLSHSPLGQEIEKAQALPVRNRHRNRAAGAAHEGAEEDDDKEERYLPKALSARLLRQVKQQQAEVEYEDEEEEQVKGGRKGKNKEPALQVMADDELENDAEDENGAEAYAVEEEELIGAIDEKEEAIMAMFMGTNADGQRSLDLGSMIMHKIKEKEQTVAFTPHNNAQELLASELDPKIVQVYGQIGDLLKTYKSGRLPKAMKILPMIENWEELLFLTRPENWSPHAAGALTKIYASNFTEKMAQRFYVLVLLPLVRDDIKKNKKLNFHLYMALKKGLYKPAAFYKGMLLPLCEVGNCSLLEATIIGSVLRKVSVPLLPSAVALLKMSQMPYNGAISVFMRVLIDKRYALPYKVLDALVHHFVSFKDETRTLPVIWHQALLALAQRYKQDITADQKQQLKALMRDHQHHLITPEIRRELFSTKSRDDQDLTSAANQRRLNMDLSGEPGDGDDADFDNDDGMDMADD